MMGMLTAIREMIIGLMLTNFAPAAFSDLGDNKLTALSLPLNYARQEQNFIVNVPTHYTMLQTVDEAEKQGFFQFAFLTTDKKAWSQKLTVHTFRNIQTMIETNFMNFEKLRLLQIPGTKVIEESTELFDSYAKSTLSMLYQEQGHPMLVHMVYYFGSRDLAGVQLTQVLADQAQADNMLPELKALVERYTQIVH